MRITIDGIPLLLRSAGVKTHLYHWIAQLTRQAGGHRIRVFPYIPRLGACEHERSMLPPLPTYARIAFMHFVNVRGNRLLDWLPPRSDVFHTSQQLFHPPRTARVTTTIYDMTCWVVPEMHRQANVVASQVFAERVIRKAAGLIANSESARADAARILGLDPERIAVIYPGIAGTYRDVPPESIRAAAERHGLRRPYVLSVGTVEPRKNFDGLLDAWGRLAAGLRSEFDLVVAGPEGWAAPRTMERLRAGDAGVRYLGYVPEDDLPGLTAGATAFAYPSFYEGFGLPLAQAMAAGVPAVTSNVSSLPEVAGEAALLVDPRSTTEIRSALERLLLSPALRAELGSRGAVRARRYTWEKYARESLAFFEKVAGAA